MLHFHVTDATYKLLDRKSYEVQERPKVTINASTSIPAYFILNKKDRSGKALVRPFVAVLEEMKRKETEDAKLKQSNSLRAANVQNPASRLASKENGLIQPLVNEKVSGLTSLEVNPASIPTIVTKDEYTTSKADQNFSLKNSDEQSLKKSDFNEPEESTKSLNRQARSRTCQLI